MLQFGLYRNSDLGLGLQDAGLPVLASDVPTSLGRGSHGWQVDGLADGGGAWRLKECKFGAQRFRVPPRLENMAHMFA